ncbi:MAG: enoyl-CoA hydratase-related protein [Brevundimonas sp.]|uniref:enoyl-CoA hydratase-related protein n=1 Tax=Brevundimonas sp. TaxID=1871086 RepID=UPI002734B607|nr:enoyl-CoA hydratase-related protein [Brevundimonas sp.]MDP3403453.1 enoyl-CoA hydratase-related protein [Brevundimonas sp.]
MAGSIDTSLKDGVFRIVLNDPARLNAMTPVLADELRSQLIRAQSGARVVVLTGSGKAFCAGANLADVMNDPEAAADGGIMLERHYNPLVRTIRDLQVPLITAVRGAAVGVGASLALLGDIVVASETAYFLQSFRRIGLVPDGGSAFLLSRAAGRVRAMEMMLLAEKLPAAKALEWGLVTRVVADDELETTVDALATELATGATFAIARIRKLAWAAVEASLDDVLDLEVETQRAAAATHDFSEGVRAFVEKRPPAFTGR